MNMAVGLAYCRIFVCPDFRLKRGGSGLDKQVLKSKERSNKTFLEREREIPEGLNPLDHPVY